MTRFAALLLMLAGCSQTRQVVRDEVTYRTEIDFMEQAAMQPTLLLEAIVGASCKCVEGAFVDPVCAGAAKKVVTIKTRVPWHKAMMLWNAGLLTVQPPKDPPEVPAPESLCPKVVSG